MTRCIVLTLVILSASVAYPQDKESPVSEKKEAELKWAKEVVTDFLNAVLGQNFPAAEVLLTEEFRKTSKEMNVAPTHILYVIATTSGGRAPWSIRREEIAPDRDEAMFRGTLKYGGGESDLALRVIKEKESGKWRVSFYDVGPVKKPEEKAKP